MLRRLLGALAARVVPAAVRRPATPVVPRQGGPVEPLPDPAAPPDCSGRTPHFATSPLPVLVGDRVLPGTGVRKFVDSLPGLGAGRRGNLGTYVPVAVPDTVTYPGCDYYEIGVQQYAQRLHSDLPPTRLRGYQQINNGTDATGRNTLVPPPRPYHLGPVILARRGRPVRVKLVNQLPTGTAGELFLPVDTTVPGARGPDGRPYPGNRTVLHLRGGDPPWISAGNPGQWFTPADEPGPHRTGDGHATVPDMPDPGPGAATLHYPNRYGGALGWFHDNSAGCARLASYAGLVGLYLVDDPAERDLVARGLVPAEQVVLVIEDKTFVPDERQLAAQDPGWDTVAWGGRGSLWFPHVYLPRQDPHAPSGTNPKGRWDYGPWHGSPGPGPAHGPRANPYARPDRPWQPPTVPGTPHPSTVPEAFHDTPLVNGVAYPYLRVEPRAYRLRILNACTDRTLNLQLYRARSDGRMWRADGTLDDGDAGEVPMVPACPTPGFPPRWPTDGRDGGVPDPAARGPRWYQIGSDGGLLPDVAVIDQQPVGYRYRRRDATVLNVADHALLLAPGERADVVVDFSSVPSGAKLILYNDCPAPVPRFDPRYDHHTGAPDRTGSGGPPPTRPGYGPNTRTLLQFQVVGTPAEPFDLAALRDPDRGLPRAYARSQPPPVVPQPGYDRAFGGRSTPTRVTVRDSAVTVTPYGAGRPVRLPVHDKTVVEGFEAAYGRSEVRLEAAGDGPAPTEVLYPGPPATPVGGERDGAQLWRIRHHGPDSRPVHFPFGVQLVGRVARDGAVRPPQPWELGWKDTVRIDPAEDTVVALRPTRPDGLPYRLADSVRPDGAADLGWEYHWRCGPVGHGATRPVVLRVSPARPTGLSATPVSGSPTEPPSIVLTWTNNAVHPAAEAIVLERSTDPTFAAEVQPLPLPATVDTYTDTDVVAEVTWYYRIRAVNAVSHSARSDTASAVVRLPAPVDLTAALRPIPPLRAALTWTNRSYATRVRVQRATNPTFRSGLVTSALPVTAAFTDPGLAPDTTYYYRCRTEHRGAASPWSTVATVRTPAEPAPPVDLTAVASAPVSGTASVELTWSVGPTSVVTGFTLHRATDAGFTGAPATFTLGGSARGFVDTGLARGTTYHYRMQAYNAVGASGHGRPVAVTTPG